MTTTTKNLIKSRTCEMNESRQKNSQYYYYKTQQKNGKQQLLSK